MKPFAASIAILLLSASFAIAQGLPDHRPEFVGGDTGFAPPPPPPLRIDGFRIDYSGSPSTAESSVQLKWDSPDIDGVTKVFRQRVQLVSQPDQSGFQAFAFPDSAALSPNGWTLIGVIPGPRSVGIHDKDIPATNLALPQGARRSLGTVHCYRVEIEGQPRKAVSPVVCTRLRGINQPQIESAEGISDSQVAVIWQDRSELESGFEVLYYEDGGGALQTITLNGPDQRRYVIDNMAADTEYWVGVRAYDYYGKSFYEFRKARTKPAPAAQPEDRTFNLKLDRQIVNSGPIPYTGRFPTQGLLPSGTLRQVSMVSQWPALFFPKLGKSTADCGNASAVVTLAPGGTLTDAEMTEIFGDATPDLPVIFVACAQATQPLYNYIPINITYRTE